MSKHKIIFLKRYIFLHIVHINTVLFTIALTEV